MDLRPIEEADLVKLWVYRNDPNIYSWCRQRDYISKESHYRWYKSLVDRDDVIMWAIREHVTDPVIGVCGLTDIDRVNSRAEFSLYIGPDYQGKGYATRALASLLDRAFKVENLNLVWGETFEGNPAYKIFEKLGMECEGVRQQFYYREGKYINALLYSITEEQWRSLGYSYSDSQR